MDDMPHFRRSCTELFYENDIRRNFAKYIGKHLCHSLFLDKVAGLTPATLLKRKLRHRCFPVKFGKFLRTCFLKEHLR